MRPPCTSATRRASVSPRPKPCGGLARRGGRARPIQPVEGREHALALGRRDPLALVGDGEPHGLRRRAGRASVIGGAPYLAAFSTRFQSARLRRAGSAVRSGAGPGATATRVPAVDRVVRGPLRQLGQERGDVDRAPGGGGRPVASSRAVVSTSSISRSSSAEVGLDVPEPRLGVALPRQEGERHPDAGQRRAQLVGDVGEELLLAAHQALHPLRPCR